MSILTPYLSRWGQSLSRNPLPAPHTDRGLGKVQFLGPQGSVWHPEGVLT